MQQFAERIDRFSGTSLSERGGVLRRAAVESVDTNEIMVIALKNRLKIVFAANKCRIERNHRRKGPVQRKQRVPFSVVEIAGKRFQKLRFHLNRQIVHQHPALQIGRHQTELLRFLLKFLQIPGPDMNQIFRFKRHIFSRTHPIDHFTERIDFGTVGNRRGIGFQITLRRSLARFQFFNGLGLVQRTQIHRDREICHVCLQQDIAVKRRQVEARKLPHDQNVVIHPVTVHPVMPFGSGLPFPVMFRMILPAELVPVNIAEIRTENFPVINFFRRKRLVHRSEELGEQFNCCESVDRKAERAFQKQIFRLETGGNPFPEQLHRLFRLQIQSSRNEIFCRARNVNGQMFPPEFMSLHPTPKLGSGLLSEFPAERYIRQTLRIGFVFFQNLPVIRVLGVAELKPL